MNKRGIENYIIYLIIAALVVVVGFIFYFLITGRLQGAVEHIINLLRFRS
jgi:hypothetical protein